MTDTNINLAAQGLTRLDLPTPFGVLRGRRILLSLALLAAAAAPGMLGEVTRGAMVDAYLQVSVFVVATLILFYGIERAFRIDIAGIMNRDRWLQPPVAAFMGALPGCGGAVFVVAAYSSGHVGMGAVVATLTATMGDAAFLLIATRPEAAAVVLPLSLVVGTVSGYVVDMFERRRGETYAPDAACAFAPPIGRTRARDLLYIALAAPGLVMGVMFLMQIDLAATLGHAPEVVGLSGVALGLLVWSCSPVRATTASTDPTPPRATEETSFVTTWVVVAYLAYEYLDAFMGVDLAAIAASAAPVVPLLAILVGFIPGCGPQVLVTTLYINGVIPFAALIGNAISNDGDALFPAIALNPRAAVLATAYSAIPALIVAYGFYFWTPAWL